jgi:hypothetical protein
MNYRHDLNLNELRSSAITLKRLMERSNPNYFEIGNVAGRMSSRLVRAIDLAPHAEERKQLALIKGKMDILISSLWENASDTHVTREKDALVHLGWVQREIEGFLKELEEDALGVGVYWTVGMEHGGRDMVHVTRVIDGRLIGHKEIDKRSTIEWDQYGKCLTFNDSRWNLGERIR